MGTRVIAATTSPVPLRPAPFACPVCGEQLGYNFIVRPGPDAGGYYLIGHDRLKIDPSFAFTLHVEQDRVKAWGGFAGKQTIEVVMEFCSQLHRNVETRQFRRLVTAVIGDVYRRPGGPFGLEEEGG
jgi:hypothetical protein